MPTISTFFGIAIRMLYQDHPPAHFHAEYQGQQGKFGFDGVMTVGNTGGDPGDAPARRAYESLGFRPLPVVRYFRKL